MQKTRHQKSHATVPLRLNIVAQREGCDQKDKVAHSGIFWLKRNGKAIIIIAHVGKDFA